MPGSSFSDYYPWHSYYSDHEIEDCKSEFGIWHIHGFCYYYRSLSIGAIDYAKNIYRLKNFITGRKNSLYSGKETDWTGKNSWVDIFMHCDLLIIGLALDSQESSLRWLFMEREKYYRKNPALRKKTIFVTTKYDNYGQGKRFLFESLKIEHEEFEKPEDIYNKWELG